MPEMEMPEKWHGMCVFEDDKPEEPEEPEEPEKPEEMEVECTEDLENCERCAGHYDDMGDLVVYCKSCELGWFLDEENNVC